MNSPWEVRILEYHSLKEGLILRIMQHAITLQSEFGYCAFIDLSGHVNILRVSIRESTENYQNIIATGEIRLDVPSYVELIDGKEGVRAYEEQIIKELQFMLQHLQYMHRNELDKRYPERAELA